MNIADPSAEDADTAAISTSGEMQAESEGSESGNDLLDETQSSQVLPINAHHDQFNFPDPFPIAEPSFLWSDVDSATLIAHMNEAYIEVLH